MNLQIVQGDSFPPDAALYVYSAVDGNGDPLDLSGREFRVTARPAPVAMATDPDDTGADVAFIGTLIVDADGTPTTQTRLFLVGAPTDGTFALVLTSDDTSGMPLATPLKSDVQMTVRGYFAGGTEDLVRTVSFDDTLEVQSGYTNRLTG